MDNTKYYVVKKKAVPEVLIKVVEKIGRASCRERV